MKKLSTGQDSTLGTWRELADVFFGPDSPAVTFIENKIASSPLGEDEEVLSDESQLLGVLIAVHRTGGEP